MSKTIKISIPKPCQENWDKMADTEQGKFCASCQKQVLVFRQSSNREIAKVLRREKMPADVSCLLN